MLTQIQEIEKVKVVVGIGDGRGYVDKKSFLFKRKQGKEVRWHKW